MRIFYPIIATLFYIATTLQVAAQQTDCARQLDPETSTGAELVQCLLELQERIEELTPNTSIVPASDAAPTEDEVRAWISEAIAPLQPFASMKGAVIAFDRSEDRGGGVAGGACPSGWTLFRAAGGRMIVGAGTHTNIDAHGFALTDYPAFSDDPTNAVGGTETETLSVDALPAHSHSVVDEESLRLFDGRMLGGSGTQGNVRKRAVSLESTETGSGRAHNNMPPFISLYFCTKDE